MNSYDNTKSANFHLDSRRQELKADVQKKAVRMVSINDANIQDSLLDSHESN